MRRIVLVGVLALGVGCGGRQVSVGDGTAGDDGSSSGGDTGTTAPGDADDDGGDDWVLDVGGTGGGPPPEPELDILFVIDNSFSMRHEAVNVAHNLEKIWWELEHIEDNEGNLGFLDDHDVNVMVTTTDVGGAHCEPSPGYVASGGSPLVEGCNARAAEFEKDGVDVFGACEAVCPVDVVPEDDFIHLDIGGASNVPGDEVGRALACLGTQGIVGCEEAQPLEAMYRALDPLAPWNTGDRPFLRDQSVLLVILISDAPDCSVSDPTIFEEPGLMNVNPDSGQPEASAAVCWNAGAECGEPDGNGVYANCTSKDAGLHPVERYQQRLSGELDREVMMLAALGVPEVTEHNSNPPFQPIAGGIHDLVYRDWRDGMWPTGDILEGDGPTAAHEQWRHGIGPGCTGDDGMGGFLGQATPPLRTSEVCQSLDGEGDIGVRCCIESICDGDFADMIRCIVPVTPCPWDGAGQGERCIPPG